MNHREPQVGYRVQQGRLLDTELTRHLTKQDKEDNDKYEKHRMFRNFTDKDKGKSRIFLATFSSPQECSDFVEMHNRLIDKIDLLEYELKEALDELKMHRV